MIAHQKRKKKWVIVEEDNEIWKFDSNKTKSASFFETIKWENAIGMKNSDTGSEGVLFIGFEHDEVIVLKGSSTVLADEFVFQLAMLVDVEMPKTRTVWYQLDWKEYSRISNTEHVLDKKKRILKWEKTKE